MGSLVLEFINKVRPVRYTYIDDRQKDGKTKAVSALKKLNFQVIAAGDSYNDTGMLQEADAGILFCPPDNVIKEFPQFPVSRNYEEFKNTLLDMRVALNK